MCSDRFDRGRGLDRRQTNSQDKGGYVGKISRGGFLKTLFAASGLPLATPAVAYQGAGPAGWHSAGLGMLPLLTRAESRQISPENPTGAKGMGARAIPNPNDPTLPFSKAAEELGQGWKVSPFLKPTAGSTITIMDVEERVQLNIFGWPRKPIGKGLERDACLDSA